MEDEDEKVLIIMSTGPENAARCATPFFLATVAAASEKQVKMIFNILGGSLMRKGVAENLAAKEGGKPIIEFIRQAKDIDVEMYLCSPSLELCDFTEDEIIEECDGVVGGAYLIQEAIEADLVLNF